MGRIWRSALGLRHGQAKRRYRMKRRSVNGVMTATLVLFLFSGAALAQLPGDLDGDGEVGLADVGAFVGCMNGPDGGSIAPACDPGNFDPDPDAIPDTDIDMRDFAGFQSRFGFGQGPPQIVSFTPAPGDWVVDDLGLTEVTVGFSEPVTVPVDPADAVNVWVLDSGTVTGLATSYDAETFLLTITFAEALRDDRVTVVIDYTIEDVAGNPLDGEIQNPKNAALPSGNNINGGQGVFRIHVLQGDANRDGVVDAADGTIIDNSLGLCDGDPGFDAMADLNNDGCVDAVDEDIVTVAMGKQLPVTDGTAPTVVGISTDGPFGGFDTVLIDWSEALAFESFNERTCFLTGTTGNIVVPALATQPFADLAVFTFVPALAKCDSYTINISNALADSSGELLVIAEPTPCP
jgi:Bacterial Ig-like domain/Dockerin type I domain